ncbi:MAG: hypothetical protein EOL88_01715 [Bacteroidia bacterium]|nr:hypothetical protein [Bacteroidia bacterium]
MPRMNGTGPEGKGPKTGRRLGIGSDIPDDEKLRLLGKGEGKKRKSGGGQGRGERKQYNKE